MKKKTEKENKTCDSRHSTWAPKESSEPRNFLVRCEPSPVPFILYLTHHIYESDRKYSKNFKDVLSKVEYSI